MSHLNYFTMLPLSWITKDAGLSFLHNAWMDIFFFSGPAYLTSIGHRAEWDGILVKEIIITIIK